MTDQAERLVMMANHIGKFFAAQRGSEPASAIADHLRKFWDPRMRAGIAAHLANGGRGLDALVREAVVRLNDQ